MQTTLVILSRDLLKHPSLYNSQTEKLLAETDSDTDAGRLANSFVVFSCRSAVNQSVNQPTHQYLI